MVKGGSKSSCGTEETCCGGNCIENCTRGQTLNLKTCICECPDGQVLCDGACKDGKTCCDIIDKSKCPNGETMIASDGCEICKCNSPTSCPEGQKLVKNYKNGVGVCGEVCVEIKQNTSSSSSFPAYEGVIMTCNEKEEYRVDFAVNNSPCEARFFSSDCSNGIGSEYSSSIATASVKENGGIYYCAIESEENGKFYGDTEEWNFRYWYPSSKKYCVEGFSLACTCSEIGNPKLGVPCE